MSRKCADAALRVAPSRLTYTDAVNSDAAARRIRALLQQIAPATCKSSPADDEIPLGTGGAGLDSIALVDLILACEAEFGTSLPAELLGQGPITIASLARHLPRIEPGSRRSP